MRRLVRHAVAGLGVTVAGAALVAATCSSGGVHTVDPDAVVADPGPDTAAVVPSPAATQSSSPAGRRVGPDVSRSSARKALTTGALQRTKLLAGQRKQIAARSTAIEKARVAAAKRAEAARRARVRALGYEPGTSDPKSIARQMMANKYGWADREFACYDNIIMRESGWDPAAENVGSGAYGIPQALPGDKMASVADDWRTNPATQIRWGLSYVQDRYGTPCNAWGFKSGHGWY